MPDTVRAVHIADWLALVSSAVIGVVLVVAVLTIRRSAMRKQQRAAVIDGGTVIGFLLVIAAVIAGYLEIDTLLVKRAFAFKYVGASGAIAREHAQSTPSDAALLEPLPRAYPSWLPILSAFAVVPIGVLGFKLFARTPKRPHSIADD